MPKVLVPLAQGCEEIEAITIVDVLRRADLDVVTAGLTKDCVKGAHGVCICPDMGLDQALEGNFDMVVLPGGLPGTDNLEADPRITGILKDMAGAGKFIGAICAAPRVLANAGLLDGKRATGYPGCIDGGKYPALTCTGAAVERDGKVITSRGPGTAMDFALAIVETLLGKEQRDTVEAGLVRT